MTSSRAGMVAIALAACSAGCGGAGSRPSTGSGSPPLHVPLKDSFVGHVTRAAGRLTGDQGGLMIELQPAKGVSVREVTVTLTGSSCRAKPRCLALVGALQGTMAPQRGLPDIGRTFALTGSGVIRPLGRVSAAGSVTGVGNARFGRESLSLTLNGGAGSVVLSAASAQVPAFTSP